jgi:hypothetical protein
MMTLINAKRQGIDLTNRYDNGNCNVLAKGVQIFLEKYNINEN